MYFNEYFPDPVFSRYIDSYFTIDTSLVDKDITDLVVPDGTFGFLFANNQKNIGRKSDDKKSPIPLKKSSIFGQKTAPVNYYFSPGNSKSFGIKINPAGLPLFVNGNIKNLNNIFIEVEKLSNSRLKELEEKIYSTNSIRQKKTFISYQKSD